jgi:hypothetical protein
MFCSGMLFVSFVYLFFIEEEVCPAFMMNTPWHTVTAHEIPVKQTV